MANPFACLLIATLLSSPHQSQLSLPTRINPIDRLTYLRIPAQSYNFGCSKTDAECFSWEKRLTPVHVQAFWIGQTEVTQSAYSRIMDSNPSLYRGHHAIRFLLHSEIRYPSQYPHASP